MTSAIIVAAGSGTRMGGTMDKMWLEIHGLPLIGHTWRQWDSSPDVDELLFVIRKEREPEFRELQSRLQIRKPVEFVEGGLERQNSVCNGLAALATDAKWVAIQDGARPCTSHELIARTLQAAKDCGAAVAARRVTDTLKESDPNGFITRTIDRARLWSVQTPQAFQVDVIRKALSRVQESGKKVTDDTAACEEIGFPVRLVESAELNPKVTTPADLPLIELLLRVSGVW